MCLSASRYVFPETHKPQISIITQETRKVLKRRKSSSSSGSRKVRGLNPDLSLSSKLFCSRCQRYVLRKVSIGPKASSRFWGKKCIFPTCKNYDKMTQLRGGMKMEELGAAASKFFGLVSRFLAIAVLLLANWATTTWSFQKVEKREEDVHERTIPLAGWVSVLQSHIFFPLFLYREKNIFFSSSSQFQFYNHSSLFGFPLRRESILPTFLTFRFLGGKVLLETPPFPLVMRKLTNRTLITWNLDCHRVGKHDIVNTQISRPIFFYQRHVYL